MLQVCDCFYKLGDSVYRLGWVLGPLIFGSSHVIRRQSACSKALGSAPWAYQERDAIRPSGGLLFPKPS